MNRVLILGVLALGLPLLNAQPTSAQANPRLGTWKLNVAKSKYEGISAAKSETRTYSRAADGATALTADAILADGTTQATNYTAKYDGKPYPYRGANGDTISVKVVDPFTTDSTVTGGGKVVQTAHSQVSADGKTLTLTTKGTDKVGKAFSSTRVYDKQ
jgi:hypothetical protein